MATNLRGVMAALLTPLTNNKHWIKRVCAAQFSSIFSRASTVCTWVVRQAKPLYRNLSEREQVLEIVAEEAKGKIKLIAHVGCVSTAESQQLAASAKRYGFDAVSAVTPFYYPFSFEEHCDHYRAIIDSADGLPMVVYNIPALSGVKLTWIRLTLWLRCTV